LWLLAFFGVQMLVQAMELLKTADQRMVANPIFFFGSLVVLLWPVLRGVPATQMLTDIGWTPKQFFRNTLLSVPSYAAWLPAVLVGFFLVFVLMGFAPLPETAGEFSVPATPGHPIQQILSDGNTLTWITIVIAACIAAPIVEETMFRGVLYRHLRGITMNHGQTISILLSALINGAIFASLHPQGILAVPLLTTLAIGFSFVREWRDSLWPSILMHAFNNSMVTFVMFCIL
jgi:membrane protease YdiL (CAAX protease family)